MDIRHEKAPYRWQCSFVFGVKDEVEASGIPLLDDYGNHPSVRGYVEKGYQVITF
jgi:hypothetical protein